jgi:hypothetical protein
MFSVMSGVHGTLTTAKNHSQLRNSSKCEKELSTSIEVKQVPKPKSPKPTGGLMTWKNS